jgi:hypothetical protein
MSLIEGFTRRETLALTETTSNRLQYLERVGLVIPERIERLLSQQCFTLGSKSSKFEQSRICGKKPRFKQ